MGRKPSKESPHRKFYDHIMSGGKVWRDDKLNGRQEWLDIEALGGDASKIAHYGYNDLSIVVPNGQGKPTAANEPNEGENA